MNDAMNAVVETESAIVGGIVSLATRSILAGEAGACRTSSTSR